ncbi:MULTISPECIES: polysaccharide deacetylase family protein [unclassified Paenibacillus]|uniref:polysaccharide deacetylase family protein n=1 Tax=unclassified Paenibacillus TaxID=185978 RepID=UPI0004660217|nr:MULTISPECIES: polysaccharide deacetylase family protein [unclassified Paenibacillus]KGP82645.1 xylanase deacetylase [Paenibacillus sp. MAEPY2]KGP89062.1 xylanase deacetylase [Paenibacillus sp. MAEPY1]
MIRHTTALIMIVCMLLSACGAKDETTPETTMSSNGSVNSMQEQSNEPTATGTKETQTTDSQSTTDSTSDQESPRRDETSTTEKEGNDNTSGQTTEDNIEKTYHMNANYYIKPNAKTSESKVVLLTFDDGPKEEKMITGLIDTLDKHGAKAIFFVNGYRVKSHPELLEIIHKRGQVVGNHAWDHEDLKKMSTTAAAKQVTDVQKIVKETIGVEPQFFRPPFGSGNDALKATVKNNGMLYMTWSNGSLDWDKSTKDKPEKVIQNVLDQLNPGSNILMHELPWTVEALDELLTKLEQKGYTFVDPRSIELEAR